MIGLGCKMIQMERTVMIGLLVLYSLVIPSLCYGDIYSSRGITGRYCESRPNGCCAGRQDECSVPISGTLCYCDDFCNRTRDDCCPDYLSFCKGIYIPSPPQPIKRCYHAGRYYNDSEVVKMNCNECRCQEINGAMEVLCERHHCLIDAELLETINSDSRHLGFRASNYSIFWGKQLEDGITQRLGTLHSRKKVLQMTPIKQLIDPSEIPRVFDSRTRWPGRISPPRDQGWCGASWVFSTVGVASDRFAIMTYGNDKQYLSPQQLLSCNSRNQRGCQGGHLTRAWTFIRKFGLVSDSCYPWDGHESDCQILRKKKDLTAVCPLSKAYGQPRQAAIHRVGPVYRISSEQGIMYEILHSGPVQATMKVTHDFFAYSSGIYRCSSIASIDRTGYHSVRIIGWGEEFQNNHLVKYWIVANSWGEWWGENGYFRIRRGTNECLIEDFVIAAWANIEDINTFISTSLISQRNNNNNYNSTINLDNNVLK